MIVIFNRGNPTRASRLNLACMTAEATFRPQWAYWINGSIFCRSSRLLRLNSISHMGSEIRYVLNTTSKQGHPTGIDPATSSSEEQSRNLSANTPPFPNGSGNFRWLSVEDGIHRATVDVTADAEVWVRSRTASTKAFTSTYASLNLRCK